MPYLCIKGPLQLHHVGVLLGVDVVIGKVHQKSVNVQPKKSAQGSSGGQTAIHAQRQTTVIDTTAHFMIMLLYLCV